MIAPSAALMDSPRNAPSRANHDPLGTEMPLRIISNCAKSTSAARTVFINSSGFILVMYSGFHAITSTSGTKQLTCCSSALFNDS